MRAVCFVLQLGLIVSIAGCEQRLPSSTHKKTPVDLIVFPTELVFDRVPFRGTAEKNVRIENTSHYEIQLYEANWQCGCMFMRFQPCKLLPGESKEFTVIMRGNSTPAALKGGVLEISTSSATNAYVKIQVRANNVYGVRCVPEAIDFGRVECDRLPLTLPLKIVVNGLTDDQAGSIKVQSNHPSISCGPLKKNTSGDYLVDVMLGNHRFTGNILSTLNVTGEGFDALSISAFAVISHAVRAHPPSLVIKGGEPGEVVLRDESGSPVLIERVEVSASLKEFVKCVPGDQLHYRVEVLDTMTGLGEIQRGMIECQMKDKDGKVITVSVPVTVFGRGK